MDVKTAYEQWLHDFAADADTIADLKQLRMTLRKSKTASIPSFPSVQRGCVAYWAQA